MSVNCSAIHVDKVLANHQAHTDAFIILLCSASKLAKHREQALHVVLPDTFSIVLYMNSHELIASRVCHVDSNEATLGKLKCIFGQIDEDLLQA